MMHLLWPSEVKYDKIFFFTDATSYLMKSTDSLFQNLISLRCLARGIHRICECIQNEYSTVDKLIATVKKVFLEAPSRVIKLFIKPFITR